MYSPQGDRLLFVSRGRPGHKQDQVYEKILATGAEKRITFQNGTTMHPRYHPIENLIIYSSSTDELKENPPLLKPLSESVSKLPFPYQEPMDIYLHSLHALEITRLSEHAGFDGEARFSNDGKEILWTRAVGQKTEVLGMNRATRTLRTLKGLGTNPTQYLTSPDGKTLAWVDWDQSFGVGRLRVFRKGQAKSQEIGTDMILTKTDLSFTPDSKWLLWAQKDPTTERYDLWSLELANMCARPIPNDSSAERRDPTVSPDMKWLTYTTIQRERSRIARAAFPLTSGPCPPTP